MAMKQHLNKLVVDIDKKLHEPNSVTKVLEQIEVKTGVKRLYLVSAVAAIQALYLIFGHFAELVCNFIGFLYPAFVSMRAIESATKGDDTQWLTYWVLFALLSMVEFFSESIVGYFPIYWLVKCIFLLYLYLPMTMGAQKIYHKLIQPMIAKHQKPLDQRLIGMASKAADNVERRFDDHMKST